MASRCSFYSLTFNILNEYTFLQYKPGFDDAYITWISNNKLAWTLYAGGMTGDSEAQISARPIPQEPMVCHSLAQSVYFLIYIMYYSISS